jgi:hypothetical protein
MGKVVADAYGDRRGRSSCGRTQDPQAGGSEGRAGLGGLARRQPLNVPYRLDSAAAHIKTVNTGGFPRG